MVEVKREDGVIHLILKETLTVKHKGQKRRGRPKEDIPDLNAIPYKVREDLNSKDFETYWKAIDRVVKICGSFRKAQTWLKTYKPSTYVGRHTMSLNLKSLAEMTESVRAKLKKMLSEAKKNPYLAEEELYEAIETAILTFTKEKLRQTTTKFPLGTKETDNRKMNMREWKLKRKAEKDT